MQRSSYQECLSCYSVARINTSKEECLYITTKTSEKNIAESVRYFGRLFQTARQKQPFNHCSNGSVADWDVGIAACLRIGKCECCAHGKWGALLHKLLFNPSHCHVVGHYWRGTTPSLYQRPHHTPRRADLCSSAHWLNPPSHTHTHTHTWVLSERASRKKSPKKSEK